MSGIAPSYTVTVRNEDDGTLWAEVDDLPGCFAAGDTLDELWENVAEAIGLYLSDETHDVAVSASSVSEIEPTARRYLVST